MASLQCGKPSGMKHMKATLWALPLLSLACSNNDAKKDTPPPGPPPATTPTAAATGSAGAGAAQAAPSAEACKSGGGKNPDAETAAFFPQQIEGTGKFCLDPEGEVRTYGEAGKYNMDEVCTTAFDGECEVYKSFKLKRVVTISYVDDAGKGVNAEVVLSRFATPEGAYGLFTKRVVADRDPKGEGVPRPLEAGAAGAIGTGRAYVVRGPYLAELQYNSDSESPSQLKASSDKLLTAIAKALGDNLKGEAELPAAAKALPKDDLISNGIQFYPEVLPGVGKIGPAAYGFYEPNGERVRVLSIAAKNDAEAKAAFAKLKGKGEAVADLGDEAAKFSFATSESGAPVDFIVARKGALVLGVGDEEYAISAGKKPLGAEALTAQAKKLLAAP